VTEVLDRKYQAFGGAAEYLRSEALEVLAESGAGTGKTFSWMQKANAVARNYPESRQVFARLSRKSLNDSVLPEWEQKVLWRGHPAIHGTATWNHREDYRYPNGSAIILHSLDNIDRILSSQYDRIYIAQAEELVGPAGVAIWEKLITRLRNGKTPYGQITADVNPAGEAHFLNKRANTKICRICFEGIGREMPLVVEMDEDQGPPVCPECGSDLWKYQMHRILYRHEDNPLWYDHDLEEWTERGKVYIGQTLGLLKGVQRERLLKHRWVAEEGIILDEWDPKTHLLDAQLVAPGEDVVDPLAPNWKLYVKDWPKPVDLVWFGAGVDWGFYPDPGVIQVWGYDELGRRFRVAEVMKTRWQIETWAECAYQLKKLFDIKYFACDPARNDHIEAFNLRMRSSFGRGGGAFAIRADNRLRSKPKTGVKDLVGIDLMRHGLRDPDGHVTTFLVRNATPLGIDKTMKKEGRPTSTEEEVTQWVYARNADGRALALPSDRCDDHGLAAWRYEVSEGWMRTGSIDRGRKAWSPTSYGARIWATYKD
jgi:phage terminase large subunit